jgi:hypothetical protein
MAVLIAILVLAFIAASAAWMSRRPTGADADIQRFNVARAMTTRWAEDPTSAPAPARGIAPQLGEDREPPSRPESAEDTRAEQS